MTIPSSDGPKNSGQDTDLDSGIPALQPPGRDPPYYVNGAPDQAVGGMGRAGSPAQDAGTHLIRTNASHGLTQHELKRLSGAVHFLRTIGLEDQLWTCAIGDACQRRSKSASAGRSKNASGGAVGSRL